MADVPELLESIEDAPLRYVFGDLEVEKAAGDDRMVMSGFLSTPRVDLSKEVVETDCFEKYLSYYQRNPIYCYNHDKSLPIGRVANPRIIKSGQKTGLYLEGITLSPIPIVKDFLWILIKDGVLTQQSAGFLSYAGKYVNDVYHHILGYLLEGSLVSIACNPEAVLDTVKSVFGVVPEGYHQYDSLGDLVQAYEKGVIRLPSEVRSTFSRSVPEIQSSVSEKTMSNQLSHVKSNAVIPDFADAEVLASVESAYDPDGVALAKPHRNAKDYKVVCDLIHAAKSEVRGSYLFQIAVPTDKGFKYDWNCIAMSMSRVLGANGGAHFTREQKSAIIDRIAEGYRALEKKLPVVEFNDGEVAVDKLMPEFLETLAYKDVIFNEGEKEAVRFSFLQQNVQSVTDALVSYQKDGEIPDAVKEVIKAIGGYVDISIYASVRDPQALAFMSSVMSMLEDYVTPSDPATVIAPEYYMDSPEALRKFAAHILERADALERSPKAETKSEVSGITFGQIKELLETVGQVDPIFLK
jgi:phage head maturation protease